MTGKCLYSKVRKANNKVSQDSKMALALSSLWKAVVEMKRFLILVLTPILLCPLPALVPDKVSHKYRFCCYVQLRRSITTSVARNFSCVLHVVQNKIRIQTVVIANCDY